MKVAGLLEELISFLEKRTNFASLYDAEIDKFKSSRDTTSFTTALKKINAEYSAANVKVLSLQSDLGKEDRDLADKVCCYNFKAFLVKVCKNVLWQG